MSASAFVSLSTLVRLRAYAYAYASASDYDADGNSHSYSRSVGGFISRTKDDLWLVVSRLPDYEISCEHEHSNCVLVSHRQEPTGRKFGCRTQKLSKFSIILQTRPKSLY